MSAKEIEERYQKNKNKFHFYINSIKKKISIDIYTISNITIIKNPYSSVFPLHYFLNLKVNTPNWILFFKNTIKFYIRQMYFFMTYIISWILFKFLYKKKISYKKNTLLIDIFLLSDTIVKEKKFQENYLKGLYEVLEENQIDYIFIPRIYSTNKNPFRLISFFKIISNDDRIFLFEFELLSVLDIFKIFWMIVIYPFKTLRLLQKENTNDDKIFNQSLLQDISTQGMNSFTRYIFGKNIAKLSDVKQIISWSEFQVIERSFNFAIRKYSNEIKLIGCQFYLNYETYFNAYIDDLDEEQQTAFHKVLVNGKVYIQKRDKVDYDVGVSLRYKEIFHYNINFKGENILLLGSYIENDTKYMLQSMQHFSKVFFKNHPAVKLERLGSIAKNITVVQKNIYELFKTTEMVIGTASGTLVEALACGKSVIIIASQDNLTANPLVEYGKGKIWELAFSKNDVEKHYNKLIKYRNEYPIEIKKISNWYKDNFFVEPTKESIVKTFELERFKK